MSEGVRLGKWRERTPGGKVTSVHARLSEVLVSIVVLVAGLFSKHLQVSRVNLDAV